MGARACRLPKQKAGPLDRPFSFSPQWAHVILDRFMAQRELVAGRKFMA